MKKSILLPSCFFLLTSVAALPPATFERGGVTFDFEACSKLRFDPPEDAAANVYRQPLAGRLPDGEKTQEWNSIARYELPAATGQTYRVALRYRKAAFETVGQPMYYRVQVRKWNAEKKSFELVDGGAHDKMSAVPSTRGTWSLVSCTVDAPAGATHLLVVVQRGDGDTVPFEYDGLRVVPVREQAPFDMRIFAAGNMDRTYVLGEGQTGELEFSCKKPAGAAYGLDDLTFTYEVPAGIEIIDTTFAKPGSFKKTVHADGSSTVSLVPYGISIGTTFNDTLMPDILMRATGKQGKCGVLKTRVDCATKAGLRFTFNAPAIAMSVGPAVKAKAVPKRYLNGTSFCYGMRHLSEAGLKAFSDTMIDAGVTWMLSKDVPHSIYPYWRSRGVRLITPYADFANGFWISPPEGFPANERWVPGNIRKTDGFYDYLCSAVCPITIYSESESFKTKMVPYLNRFAEGADGVWANWEPFMFRHRGCFCDRCCKAFADYIGRPYEEIRKDWPANVMKGGAYNDRVEKFRSIQHGKLVKTLDKYITAATGSEKSVGFIPAICYIEMGSWWRPRNYASEVQAIDYADKLKWIDPWGPYPWWSSESPYFYNKRLGLCYYYAAKDVRETVDRDYPAASRPKLMALPHGFQNFCCLTQPEYIALAMDSFFFNGWESTIEYFFPRGYDSRYWAAFAAATERSAKYEDIVYFGKRADGRVQLEPLAGLYATPVTYLSGYLPAVTNVPMLTAAAYDWNDRHVVAVLNFWEKGEAFFNLKFAGLPATNAYTIVTDDGVLRAKDAVRTTWTGAELAKGVLLHVGAARTRVFEVRAVDASSVDAIVPIASEKERTSSADADETSASTSAATFIMTDEMINKELESRRPILKRAAEIDAEYERGSFEKKGTSSDKDAAVI